MCPVCIANILYMHLCRLAHLSNNTLYSPVYMLRSVLLHDLHLLDQPSSSHPNYSDNPPMKVTLTLTNLTSESGTSTGTTTSHNSSTLQRYSEYLLEHTDDLNEAYKIARQVYIDDPFYVKGILVYIACLVELGLTAELFYLGTIYVVCIYSV